MDYTEFADMLLNDACPNHYNPDTGVFIFIIESHCVEYTITATRLFGIERNKNWNILSVESKGI